MASQTLSPEQINSLTALVQCALKPALDDIFAKHFGSQQPAVPPQPAQQEEKPLQQANTNNTVKDTAKKIPEKKYCVISNSDVKASPFSTTPGQATKQLCGEAARSGNNTALSSLAFSLAFLSAPLPVWLHGYIRFGQGFEATGQG